MLLYYISLGNTKKLWWEKHSDAAGSYEQDGPGGQCMCSFLISKLFYSGSFVWNLRFPFWLIILLLLLWGVLFSALWAKNNNIWINTTVRCHIFTFMSKDCIPLSWKQPTQQCFFIWPELLAVVVIPAFLGKEKITQINVYVFLISSPIYNKMFSISSPSRTYIFKKSVFSWCCFSILSYFLLNKH